MDGVIEDAKVSAGKDIIVSQGIHGQGTHEDISQEDITMVEAKGSLKTKFIDHAFAKAGGDILMDYALNCVIEAGGKVTAHGTRGVIAGGNISAFQGVEADKLGNQAELGTEIKVGESAKVEEMIAVARQKIKEVEEKLAGYPGDLKPEYLLKMLEITRKQMKEAEMTKWQSLTAPIIVHNMVYPNVKLLMGTAWAPDMTGKSRMELRNINGRILSKPIGAYTQEEITAHYVDSDAEVVAV